MESGGKEALLTDFLKHFRDVWGISAIAFTLSDKDSTEINAFRAVWPKAKHQLCYWHCNKAVKKRLAILRRMPGPYNAEAARREFPFISKDFVPFAQQKGGTTGKGKVNVWLTR